MRTPDSAIEAAAVAEYVKYIKVLRASAYPQVHERFRLPFWAYLPEVDKEGWREKVAPIVKAAAPHIAAQGLRDYARTLDDDTLVDAHMIHEAADRLEDRA